MAMFFMHTEDGSSLLDCTDPCRGADHSPARFLICIRSGSKTMVSDAWGSHGLFALWGGNLSATLKTEKC